MQTSGPLHFQNLHYDHLLLLYSLIRMMMMIGTYSKMRQIIFLWLIFSGFFFVCVFVSFTSLYVVEEREKMNLSSFLQQKNNIPYFFVLYHHLLIDHASHVFHSKDSCSFPNLTKSFRETQKSQNPERRWNCVFCWEKKTKFQKKDEWTNRVRTLLFFFKMN